ARTGFTVIYQVNGVEYAYFPNWSKNQRISKPQASILPSPSSSEEQSRNDSALNRGTSAERFRRRARSSRAGGWRQETGDRSSGYAGRGQAASLRPSRGP